MSSGGDIIRTVVPVAAAIAVTVVTGNPELGWAAWQIAAAASAAAIVASLAVNAAFPIAKPDLSFDYDFGDFDTGRTQVVRQAISFRRIIYGRCRVGGVYTFIESTKDAVAPAGGQVAGNGYLHMLFTVAGHPVDAIESLYLNDDIVYIASGTHEVQDAGGNPLYAGNLWAWTGDGTTAGDADLLAALNESCPNTWTAAHKQQGCAKVYLRHRFGNGSAWAGGLPRPSVIVRGKKVYDPRTAATAYSNNAALCLRDYIISPLGLNAASTKLPDTEWSAEANICDEDVALAAGGTENRYECNGVVDLDTPPKKILQALLTACAGRLVDTSGQWLLYTGAYRMPTVTLTLDDLDGPIKIASRISRRDLFNGVKGTYVDPGQAWQATDFPPVQVAAYVTEDQEEALWKDVAMAYTTSGSMAQRIARVELERGRRQITVNLSCKLSAYQCMTAETVMLTVPRYGWSAKVFEVMAWGFTLRADGDGAPRLGIDLTLRETDSGVFSWTSAQEQTINVAPRTNLPNPSYVTPPTNLTAEEELYSTRAGAGVKAKVVLSWTASPDGFATEYEVEFQVNGGEWQTAGRPKETTVEVLDAAPGLYVFRVRARNNRGATSAWTTHTQQIAGLSAAPADPSSLSIQVINNNVHASWPQSADLDVRVGGRVRMRFAPVLTGATWQNSFDIGPSIPGAATNAAVPALTGTYMIKYEDSMGVASAGHASAVTTVPNMLGMNVVATLNEAAGGFTGAKTSMYVDGAALKLSGAGLFDDVADVDALADFDTAGGVALSGTYAFASMVDLGTAGFTSRVTANLEFTVSQIGDTIDARLDNIDDWRAFDSYELTEMAAEIQVATTDDDPAGAATWSDWAAFVVGDYYARGFKFRLVVTNDAANHQISVTALSIQVDMPDKTQGQQGLTAAAGGTDVTYPTPFKAVPALTWGISNAQSGDVAVISSETATGFHIQVTNGVGVERTFNYTALGYF